MLLYIIICLFVELYVLIKCSFCKLLIYVLFYCFGEINMNNKTWWLISSITICFKYGYGVPYRFDRSSKGGGILFYTCKDIPLKFLKTRFDCNIDSINSRKRKWLLMIHIVPVKALSNHLEYLNRIIDDNYRQKLPKFLVSGRL